MTYLVSIRTLLQGRANISKLTQLFVCALVCGAIATLWIVVPHPLVVIVLCLLPLALTFVLRNPYPIILGFVIISFFRIHEVIPQLFTLRIPLLLALGSLVSLAWGIFSKRITLFWTKELTVFALFFCHATMSVFLASDRATAMAYFTNTYVKIGIMVLAISWLCANIHKLRYATFAFVLAGITVAVVALSNKAKGIGLVEGTRVTIGRDLGSTLGDPNDLSLVLLFPAGFSLAIGLNKGNNWLIRLAGLLTFVLMGAAIVATQSRGGLLGIAAVAGIFAYRRIKSKMLLGFIGVLCLGVLFAFAGINDRQSGGAHEEGIDESAMGRIHAWVAAFRMATHNPFSGVGLDNFILNYFTYSDFWDGKNHAVHSTWFGVLGETGFVGLILFIAMIVIIFKTTLNALAHFSNPNAVANKQVREQGVIVSEGLLGALTGFCISGTFLTMGFIWPIYIILSLSVALGVIVNQTRLPAKG